MYCAYAVLSIDKSIIAVVAEPLRIQFGLNDSQVGFLTGMAYALPFALTAIPMGRMVDRLNRKRLLTILVSTWSAFTCAGAFVQNYFALVMLRCAIGAAEAGGPPAMMSILTDGFDNRHRPRAFGIYYTAAPAGAMVGALAGSWIAGHWGWQATLMTAAVPGLLLALMLAFCLREPRRGFFDDAVVTEHPSSRGWKDAMAFAARKTPIRAVITAMTLNSTVIFALSYWIMPLLMRTYGIGIARAGAVGSFGLGLAGALGSFTGGWLATRYMGGRQDLQLRLCAFATLGAVPAVLLGVLAASPEVAMLGFGLSAFFNAVCFGPSFSFCLSSAPVAIRGTIAALVMLLANIFGGLGPLLVGMSSDALSAAGFHGPLGLAIAGITLFNLVAGPFYLHAARR